MEPKPPPPEPSAGQGDASSEAALFRREAFEHHLTPSEEGALLRVSPSWARWTYWLLLGVVTGALLFIVTATVPVHESGPALIRVSGSIPLSAPLEGAIESVEALPGQQVSGGDVLVRFGARQETAQLEMIQGEFDLQLLARLRDPEDASAGRELRRLRPELERARAAVERTLVRAPVSGVVQDVRIRSGDFLSMGDHVLTLVPAEPEYTIIAFLPGHTLPQLKEELPVRIRVTGYAYAFLSTSIESVGRQVIGPAEARRYLGSEIEDAVDLSGPVVVVRCRLREHRFEALSGQLRIYDGLRATASVEVRRERLLYRLIPGMRTGLPDA